MMSIVMNEITLYVSDVERSRHFYSALGFELEQQNHPGRPISY